MTSWFQRMLGKHPTVADPESACSNSDQLSAGIAREKAGQQDAAEAVYREILLQDGNSVAALRLLGKLLAKTDRLGEAEEMLARAHGLHPDDADLACDLCNVYQLLGELTRARQCYNQALETDPSHPLLHYNLATTLLGLGDKEAAIREIESAVRLEPSFYKARRHLSLLLFEQGIRDKAIPLMKSLLSEFGEDATLYYCLGRHAYEEGSYDEAINNLQRSITLGEKHKEAFLYLGICLEKIAAYEEALQAAEKSLEIDRDSIHGMLVVGRIYLAMENTKDAENYFQKAVSLEPGNASLFSSIGDVYLEKKIYPNAMEYFKSALRIQPDQISALINMGACYQEIGKYSEAVEYYQQVLGLEPGNVDAHWNYSLSLLLNGEFGKGWNEYEWGLQIRERKIRKSDIRIWKGEKISDQSILARAEQGLGDEIMFASCLPDLIASAGHVYIECDQRLADLYKRSFRDATTIGINRQNPPLWQKGTHSIDLQIPVGSLPMYFRKKRDEFPMHGGYLRADPVKVARWKERLASLGDGVNVGISWRGGTPATRAEIRSTTLEQWLPVFRVPDVNFINLQYADSSEELSVFQDKYPVRIHTWDIATGDIDEAAALVVSLDLVISVQTALVHLGGALGVPVWVLVPSRPEWRYLGHGKQMPWYPSVQLFRQLPGQTWESVTQQISTSLAATEIHHGH